LTELMSQCSEWRIRSSSSTTNTVALESIMPIGPVT
jgi:hypothetical protein